MRPITQCGWISGTATSLTIPTRSWKEFGLMAGGMMQVGTTYTWQLSNGSQIASTNVYFNGSSDYLCGNSGCATQWTYSWDQVFWFTN